MSISTRIYTSASLYTPTVTQVQRQCGRMHQKPMELVEKDKSCPNTTKAKALVKTAQGRGWGLAPCSSPAWVSNLATCWCQCVSLTKSMPGTILVIGPYSLSGLGDRQCGPCRSGGGMPQVCDRSCWLLPQSQGGSGIAVQQPPSIVDEDPSLDTLGWSLGGWVMCIVDGL